MNRQQRRAAVADEKKPLDVDGVKGLANVAQSLHQVMVGAGITDLPTQVAVAQSLQALCQAEMGRQSTVASLDWLSSRLRDGQVMS